MTRPLLLSTALLVLGACSPPALACPPGMQQAALEHLAPSLGWGPSDISVWIGRDDAQTLNALEAKVRATRQRVAKIAEPCSRAAYNGWLDWYETEIASGRSELRDHHQKKEMDAYEAGRRRDAAQARAAHIRELP